MRNLPSCSSSSSSLVWCLWCPCLRWCLLLLMELDIIPDPSALPTHLAVYVLKSLWSLRMSDPPLTCTCCHLPCAHLGRRHGSGDSDGGLSTSAGQGLGILGLSERVSAPSEEERRPEVQVESEDKDRTISPVESSSRYSCKNGEKEYAMGQKVCRVLGSREIIHAFRESVKIGRVFFCSQVEREREMEPPPEPFLRRHIFVSHTHRVSRQRKAAKKKEF